MVRIGSGSSICFSLHVFPFVLLITAWFRSFDHGFFDWCLHGFGFFVPHSIACTTVVKMLLSLTTIITSVGSSRPPAYTRLARYSSATSWYLSLSIFPQFDFLSYNHRPVFWAGCSYWSVVVACNHGVMWTGVDGMALAHIDMILCWESRVMSVTLIFHWSGIECGSRFTCEWWVEAELFTEVSERHVIFAGLWPVEWSINISCPSDGAALLILDTPHPVHHTLPGVCTVLYLD